MKKVTKLIALLLVVLITAAPLSSSAAYADTHINDHNIRYEAKKYTSPKKGYASLQVVKYGAVPDVYTAGLIVEAKDSNNNVLSNSQGFTITYTNHGFSLSADAPVTSGTISYAKGYYAFMGVQWNYTSTGVLNVTSGSFD